MVDHRMTQAQRRRISDAEIAMNDLLKVTPVSEWPRIMSEAMLSAAQASGQRPADAALIVESTGELIARAGHMAGRRVT